VKALWNTCCEPVLLTVPLLLLHVWLPLLLLPPLLLLLPMPHALAACT
jgi:hypothetical protein